MERMPVQSSTIAEIGYDREAQVLEVLFLKGGLYRYQGVPSIMHQELMAAESQGKFLASRIKGAFVCEKVLR